MSRTRTARGSNLSALSRIGQRRQVVIPKRIIEELGLEEGDFMEVTAEQGRVSMKPKRLVDADKVLTAHDERKIRRGETQLKRGQSKLWRSVKHALDR